MSCDLIPRIRVGKKVVDSILFPELLKKTKDRSLAIKIYEEIHSDEFLTMFGDWINNPNSVRDSLDKNGEPKADLIFPYVLPNTVDSKATSNNDLSSTLSAFVESGDSVSKVLNNIVSLSNTPAHVDLAERLKSSPITGAKFVNVASGNFAMQWNSKRNEILINVNEVSKKSADDIERILLHEIIHAYTGEVLSAEPGKLTPKEAEFSKDIGILYSIAKNRASEDFKSAKGLENKAEFVAEALTNSRFQSFLVDINKGNFWNKLVSFFQKFLGLRSNRDVLNKILTFINTTPVRRIGLDIKLNFDTEETIKNKAVLSDKEKTLVKVIDSLARRINEFSRSGNPVTQASVAATKVQLAKLRKNLRKSQTDLGLVTYAKQSHEDIKVLYNGLVSALNNDSVNLALLNKAYKYSKAFNIVGDVQLEVETDARIKEVYGNDIIPLLSDSEAMLKKIERIYQKEIKRLMIDKLLPYEDKAEAQFRQRAEKLFNERELEKDKADRFKGHELSQKREEFIESLVDRDRDQIEESSRRILSDQFELATQDINGWEYWATGIQHNSDQLLAISKELIDRAQDSIREEYIDFENDLNELHQALIDHKGNISNPKELYKEILEIGSDGELTGNFVSAYSSEFQKKTFEMIAEASSIKDAEKRSKFKKAWYKANAKQNPEWTAGFKQMQIDKAKVRKAKGKEAASEFAEAWIRSNHSKRWLPKDKWKNKQFEKLQALGKDHPVVKYYNFVIKSQDNFDKGRPEFKQLGFRLPAIRKSGVERVISQGLDGLSYQSVKEGFSEMFKRVEDDTEFGSIEVSEDIEGKTNRFVPIHFTSKKIKSEDQSFDVSRIIAMNAYMSMNHREMTKVLPEMEALRTIFNTRQVVQKSSKGLALIKRGGDGDFHTVKGEQSNTAKLYEAFLQDKLFGESYVDKDFAGISPKAWGGLMKYTSTVMLAFNVVASFTNVLFGGTMFQIEKFARGHVKHAPSRKGWFAATRTYFDPSDVIKNLNDIGANDVTSFTNLMSEKFDSLNDFKGSRFNYVDNKYWKKLLSANTLHGLNNLGEHFLQNITMYGILSDIRVKNEAGEYINKDGKVVPKKDAMSLLEAYSIEDGKLVVNPIVKKININGKTMDWNKNARFKTTQRIRHVNELLHGAYSQQNRPEMQRFVWGRLIMMMKKWVEPGIRRRLRGFSSAFSGNPEKFWSQQLGEYEQGAYTTAVGFMTRLIKDARKGQFQWATEWKTMTEWERTNAKRAAFDFGMMAVAWTTAKVLAEIAEETDDEDIENELYFLAYQARRLQTELAFYVNPPEALKIIQDPTPTVSIVEDAIQLITQAGGDAASILTGGDAERYQNGSRKGNLKIVKNVTDIVPFYRHWDRLSKMKDSLAFFNR